MQRLKVRCCCQPTKVFGTLPVSDRDIARRGFVVPARPEVPYAVDAQDHWFSYTGVGHEVKIRSIRILKDENWVSEWAIYSEDRPIEFWRRVPGFVEDPSSVTVNVDFSELEAGAEATEYARAKLFGEPT